MAPESEGSGVSSPEEELPFLCKPPNPLPKQSKFVEMIGSVSSGTSDCYDLCAYDSTLHYIPRPRNTLVIRGGFPSNNNKANEKPKPKLKAWRGFPPAPGTAYEPEEKLPVNYSGNSLDNYVSQRWGDAARSSEQDSEYKHDDKKREGSEETGSTSSDPPISGKLLADTINFNRHTWITTTPGVVGQILSPTEQREDFITEMDSGAKLDYCKKCNNAHIAPGPPITLQDRDICGAYLPEWFPDDKVEHPWDTFTQFHNEIVMLDEIAQGYTHQKNPDRKIWDKEYHEPHRIWLAIGRKSGWWKCRTGPDASEVERTCRLCHDPRKIRYYADVAEKQGASGAERKVQMMAFMDRQMRVVGERDRSIALGRIRAEGWPQHLGANTTDLPSHILPPISGPERPPRE